MEEEANRLKQEKYAKYNNHVIETLEGFTTGFPENMRESAQKLLDEVRSDSSFNHLYCRHESKLTNSDYILVIRRQNGTGPGFYRGDDEWLRTADDHNRYLIYERNSYCNIYAGKYPREAVSNPYNYVQEVSERDRHNAAVVHTLERLVINCPSNMKEHAQLAANEAKSSKYYVHVFVMHTDSLDNCS